MPNEVKILIINGTLFFRRENKAKGGGICVANHTSPIDIVILSCDNTYAMVSTNQI